MPRVFEIKFAFSLVCTASEAVPNCSQGCASIVALLVYLFMRKPIAQSAQIANRCASADTEVNDVSVGAMLEKGGECCRHQN
jgi:hypothetical protein